MMVYFIVIVEKLDLFIIIYNIFGCVGVKMMVMMIFMLVYNFNIIGIK